MRLPLIDIRPIEFIDMVATAYAAAGPAPQAPTSGLRYLADHVEAAITAPIDEMAERMDIVMASAANDRHLIPAEARIAQPGSYARHLMHADPEGRFSIVALAWGPGQFSPVHAHHTWCAYAVIAGHLTETTYSYDAASGLATPLETETLGFGATRFEYAGISAVHKLGNAGDNVAVSLHIYGIDGPRIATHVNRLMRVAQQ